MWGKALRPPSQPLQLFVTITILLTFYFIFILILILILIFILFLILILIFILILILILILVIIISTRSSNSFKTTLTGGVALVTLNTNVITDWDMCKECTEAVHCAAL